MVRFKRSEIICKNMFLWRGICSFNFIKIKFEKARIRETKVRPNICIFSSIRLREVDNPVSIREKIEAIYLFSMNHWISSSRLNRFFPKSNILFMFLILRKSKNTDNNVRMTPKINFHTRKFLSILDFFRFISVYFMFVVRSFSNRADKVNFLRLILGL